MESAKTLGSPFDRNGDLVIYEHCRPHWSQAGAVVFITFRTHDSIPREVIERWDHEKQEWLRAHGNASGQHWSVIVPTLPERDRTEFQRTFDRCKDVFLDSCHGRCLLRRPELANIVADSLMHFEGDRYRMGDFAIMPNHVHLLAVFPTAEAMRRQCDSWLHYTAFRINQTIGAKGQFWQEEPFDHLVRSPEQYEYLRQYIADNPARAGLKPGEYHYRRLGQ
jgi:putative transposase